MPNVQLSITLQCAIVYLVTPEMHIPVVIQFPIMHIYQYRKIILVDHRHAVYTASVMFMKIIQFARV